MSFLKDAGHALVQGPMTYSFTKPLQMMGKLDSEDMRDASALSALIGGIAAGGVAAGPAAGGANAGAAGGAAGAPSIGPYPGITPGTVAGPSALTQALKIGSFLGSQQAPQLPNVNMPYGGQITSSKSKRR